MSKRLQVVMDDDEYNTFERRAADLGMTLSQWVRQSLKDADRRWSTGDVAAKLAAIDAAASHPDPAPAVDIDQMLAEIEAGYLRG